MVLHVGLRVQCMPPPPHGAYASNVAELASISAAQVSAALATTAEQRLPAECLSRLTSSPPSPDMWCAASRGASLTLKCRGQRLVWRRGRASGERGEWSSAPLIVYRSLPTIIGLLPRLGTHLIAS